MTRCIDLAHIVDRGAESFSCEISNTVQVKSDRIHQTCCTSVCLKTAEDLTRLRVKLRGEMAVKRLLSMLLETRALFPALPPPRHISHSAVT